ncbi:MarR family winged helix-turn-helix transcriptional regulator [Microbacterium sp. P05]|uniref:MarR family winged helix-turn-helix transcriptional regulator n=1 Tax=Microbacterium sp. P05 TaxID=3366948 RepID=UPI0037462AB7
MTHAEDIGRLIIAANALTRMAALTADTETPAAQWRTLKLLRDHGALRVGELATISRVSQPGMTRLIGQMHAAGLVERSADAADSRAIVVSATASGERALDDWLAQLQDALLPFFADLDEADWEAVQRTADLLARKTTVASVGTAVAR